VYSFNVVNWIQKLALLCAVVIILIAVQQRVYSCNVVNWIQNFVLHCALLLIVLAVQ